MWLLRRLGKELVRREQDPVDRRKNVVTLTDAGRTTLAHALEASNQAERRFLGSLSGHQIADLTDMLRAMAD